MATPNSPAVYQLRIRLDRISPLIWRRLLVPEATTIAELHAIIQIAFGWSDSHLHQFIIHGKHYGIAYLGGVSFADNPDQVRLADFHFRTGERFSYEYNFHVPWRHEIRVLFPVLSTPQSTNLVSRPPARVSSLFVPTAAMPTGAAWAGVARDPSSLPHTAIPQIEQTASESARSPQSPPVSPPDRCA
jgi:Plasmid pRiA4b ORF-3-like protein